jgi:hypothetical protein
MSFLTVSWIALSSGSQALHAALAMALSLMARRGRFSVRVGVGLPLLLLCAAGAAGAQPVLNCSGWRSCRDCTGNGQEQGCAWCDALGVCLGPERQVRVRVGV